MHFKAKEQKYIFNNGKLTGKARRFPEKNCADFCEEKNGMPRPSSKITQIRAA